MTLTLTQEVINYSRQIFVEALTFVLRVICPHRWPLYRWCNHSLILMCFSNRSGQTNAFHHSGLIRSPPPKSFIGWLTSHLAVLPLKRYIAIVSHGLLSCVAQQVELMISRCLWLAGLLKRSSWTCGWTRINKDSVSSPEEQPKGRSPVIKPS